LIFSDLSSKVKEGKQLAVILPGERPQRARSIPRQIRFKIFWPYYNN